jgi:hypothetical protein
MPSARNLRLLPVFGFAVLAAAGCSKPPPAPTLGDSVPREEFDDLRRDYQKLKESWEAANRAASSTGLETADMGVRMLAFDKRMKAMEEQISVLSAASAAGGTTGSAPTVASGTNPGATGTPGSGDGTAPLVPGNSTDVPFTEEQITQARRLLDEVDKRKTDEQQSERLRNGLERIGVSLSANEFNSLRKLDQSYRKQMTDIWRNGFGRTDDERRVATEKQEALKLSWENDLRNIVSGASADKIIENAGRFGFPGFAPRRVDGRVGMNNR